VFESFYLSFIIALGGIRSCGRMHVRCNHTQAATFTDNTQNNRNFTVLAFVYRHTLLLHFHRIVMKCAALPLLASSYAGSHVHEHEHRGYCTMNLKRAENFVCSVKRKFPHLSSKQNIWFNM
jgi:hypothetical protein